MNISKALMRLCYACTLVFLFCQCQEGAEVQPTPTENNRDYTQEKTNPLPNPPLTGQLVTGQLNGVFFRPTDLEVVIRRVGETNWVSVSQATSCLQANTEYQVMATVPSQGSAEKVCTCLTIRQNGPTDVGPTRTCKDTSIFFAEVPGPNISFQYSIYNVRTGARGRLIFEGQAGCAGNNPRTSFGKSKSLDIGIASSGNCL